MERVEARCRSLIRDVPDHPKPGIVFKDITPLLGDASAFAAACQAMSEPYLEERVSHVIAIESRGFMFGGVVATQLGAGLIPIRKPGKLPWTRLRQEYALEYGTDALEMHEDALPMGARVLIVDDVLATGGTASAALQLASRRGAHAVGCSFLVELSLLRGRSRLDALPVSSVVTYGSP
jgi:adenine phosphoribosyltransferase